MANIDLDAIRVMERLTKKTESGSVEIRTKYLANSHRRILDRLSAYEDSGLTLERCAELARENII